MPIPDEKTEGELLEQAKHLAGQLSGPKDDHSLLRIVDC
jgi:hypothetical protein